MSKRSAKSRKPVERVYITHTWSVPKWAAYVGLIVLAVAAVIALHRW